MRRHIDGSELTPDQAQKLRFVFSYEKIGPFVTVRVIPDEPVFAVYGDWNGDGECYWEVCNHCFEPIMESQGFKL